MTYHICIFTTLPFRAQQIFLKTTPQAKFKHSNKTHTMVLHRAVICYTELLLLRITGLIEMHTVSISIRPVILTKLS